MAVLRPAATLSQPVLVAIWVKQEDSAAWPVSLEFTHGHELPDLGHVLEGKGKYRRHIKLTSQSDFDEKSVRSTIERAFP